MAGALKVIHRVWAWLARYGADRALNDGRIARYVERRRHEVLDRGAHLVAELDERTIRDVGLEGWRSPLGAEVERRRHLARRWERAARFGFF